jgi:hypothetical protein
MRFLRFGARFCMFIELVRKISVLIVLSLYVKQCAFFTFPLNNISVFIKTSRLLIIAES